MAQQDPEERIELTSETRDLLEENDLRPLWEVEKTMGNVYDDLQPDIWKWADIKETIDNVEEDMPIEELPPGFQRRVAVPINTGMENAISNTIYLGVQTVSPGETAPSHRHGANALRFTIDGHEDMKTVVAGEEFPMENNDLITTPQWEWHDHVNDSDETAMWLDVLDLPLVLDSLNSSNVFENHELERQPVTKTQGYWDSQFGQARPADESKDDGIPGPFEGIRDPTPPHRFSWEETVRTLRQRADNNTPDPYDGYSMAYVNPTNGQPPLFPTMSFRAQLLQEATETHFHNATEVYFVIEGEGATHVGDETLEWSQWDIFVVPPNELHSHEPDGEEAILLGMTDRPVFEAFNFYAESAPSE
ncbi:cupin domain-containing protein [Natronolimnohabitans innermongolicus]|uniref:Gentisate 1,2-dioxygenase n=1 Tax=Natronolimnohabitans innermongolicus JCM 12255 TaxID=1227499 RepID=L9WNW1_9EURY|nr:cupin domain-containing protein [Natronolimnohabitans innermongolicus]ELY50911.1 gentisate 1,2-dioxygenase [Natronolimnohabitans innermongolicus JCM 12255]